MAKVNVNAEILKAADVQPKRNEDRQVFLQRVVRAVADLDDKAWEGLSSDAQDWYNEAADQMNAKKTITEMPGFEDEAKEETKKEEAAPARRRGAEPKEEAKAKEPEPELADPKVGDTVKLKTKRGEEFEGKVTEIDEDEIVLDVDGEDEAFRRSKVESISIVGGKKAEKPKAEPKEDAKKEDAPKADKPKREPPKRDPSKKPVTQRMRELICENDEADKAEISKMLKDEGLEFRDATLDIMFTDTQKTIQTLKDLKRFK